MGANGRPAQVPARATRPARGLGDAFALLAESLLVGVYVLVASLPVITLPAALAAGTAHLRRHVSGQATDLGRFVRDWRSAVRDLWILGVAGVVLAGILALNARIAASGLLPGGGLVGWAGLAAAVASAIVILRTASAWSLPDDDGGRAAPPRRARDLVRLAVRSAREDATGSLLLAVAIGLSGVLVWMLAPLAAVVGGLLCLAAVAVDSRNNR